MSPLDAPVVRTRIARAGWDEHSYYGHRVFADLAGRESVASLLALSAVGRRLPLEDARVLDDIMTVWTVADPRIWPLKLTRLVASYGGLVQGIAAGYLSLDNPFIGVLHVSAGAARFLLDVQQRVQVSSDASDLDAAVQAALAANPRPQGFGVPFRDLDERVPALRRCLIARGRHERTWWRLFEQVWPLVQQQRGLPPNIAGAYAAACLDLGLSPDELSTLALGVSIHVFLAHAAEGAAQQHPVLQRLPAGSVRYAGTARRLSPRARAWRDSPGGTTGGSSPR
ncbi:MAG: hypothetical protein ABIJ09_02655 [Pseudomonadota bacterium]